MTLDASNLTVSRVFPERVILYYVTLTEDAIWSPDFVKTIWPKTTLSISAFVEFDGMVIKLLIREKFLIMGPTYISYSCNGLSVPQLCSKHSL